jgi:energy-coupling factor transporter transmembrane protein EcfT
MSFTTIFIIAGVILLLIFFVIAKLAIRWAIRVALVGAIIAALFGAAGFWWWSNQLAGKPTQTRQPATPGRRSANR